MLHRRHVPAIATTTATLACLGVVASVANASGDGPAGEAQDALQPGALSPGGSLGEAFSNSFAMIIATELGDKTFFIAALLAMRHDRLSVFAGAAGALAAMTVLSAGIGLLLPALLPKQYTHYAAVLLFVYFGLRQGKEAMDMFSTGEGAGPSDELAEVEKSLEESKPKSSVAMQALTLTFLAEWGDRSQIGTIAMAAAKEPIGVTLGGIVGHSCCTSLAVIGGRVLASQISERVVAMCGAFLFLGFAVHGAIMGAA